MSDALLVLDVIQSGGSGTGISYYTAALECARKARLDRETGGDDSDDADVGTAFHAIADPYYSRKADRIVIAANLQTESTQEAVRLWAGYRERYSREDVGKVLCTERPFPEGSEEEQVVRDLLGVPWTGRVDMVPHLDEQACRGLILKNPELGDGLEEGIWGWDFKTKSRRSESWKLEYQLSYQFMAYPAVWNALHGAFPDRYPGPMKGMIADIIVRHKKLDDRSFERVCIPYDPARLPALRTFLRQGYAASLTDEPNGLNCMNWGRVCPHYLSGRCDRT